MIEQRPHITYAVYSLRRFRLLFLLPMARILWALFRGQMPTLRWYEGVVGAALIGYAWWEWRCCRYHVSASSNGRFYGIRVCRGPVCRRTLHIAAEEAASVEIERTPLLRLLGGCRVRVNTAGLRRRSDVQLYLSAAQTRALFPHSTGGVRYRARLCPVAVMALTGSNAAVGLLTAVPILRSGSRLWGQTVPLYGSAAWLLVSHGDIASLLRLGANLLLIGWGVAALRNFLRYAGFRARREGDCLHLVSGLFTRRDVLLDVGKITALEWRQTVSMRLLRLYTVVITAAGYGRDIGARPVLIPAAGRKEAEACLRFLFPECPAQTAYCSPVAGAWRRYTAAPLCLLVFGIGWWLLGGWWNTVSLLWTLASLWWLAARLFACRHAGFSCCEGRLAVCYPRGLAVHWVVLSDTPADCVTVSRSVWQRRRGSCTVRLRCFGEKRRTHGVWEMPYEAVMRSLT